MMRIIHRLIHCVTSSSLKILLAFGFVCSLVLLLPAKPTQAIGYLTVKVTDPFCKTPGALWSYSSTDAAVKDTIPLEWWPPANLGGTLTHSGVQTAAVIIRSRIEWERLFGSDGTYHYSTANLDTRKQPPDYYPSCQTYTMNTVNGAGNSYSGQTYDSNSATDETTGNYIVDINGNVNMVGFHQPVQQRSTICAEQSDDWKFCSVSSLAAEVNSSNNKYSRRINTMPTDRIRFETEAFASRFPDSSGHFWYCLTSDAGYKKKCYMQALPNNGTINRSNVNYIALSTELRYSVAFPVMATAPARKTYYVWVRGLGCSSVDKSVHAGLNMNSTLSANSDDMTGWVGCSYIWSRQWINYNNPCPCPSGDSYIQVQWDDGGDGAFENISLWMREDGMRVDRVILASDVNYNPNNDPGFADGY